MLGQADGTAGTTYQPIVFVNLGATPCELHGYPGVSFVDSMGVQIGQSAAEDAATKVTITLNASGEANALLRQPDTGNFDPAACHVTTADRLKVYPPGDTVPLFVHDAVQVCSGSVGRTGVRTVASGNGS
jgi:Protein of unknown function (DUF4232)